MAGHRFIHFWSWEGQNHPQAVTARVGPFTLSRFVAAWGQSSTLRDEDCSGCPKIAWMRDLSALDSTYGWLAEWTCQTAWCQPSSCVNEPAVANPRRGKSTACMQSICSYISHLYVKSMYIWRKVRTHFLVLRLQFYMPIAGRILEALHCTSSP